MTSEQRVQAEQELAAAGAAYKKAVDDLKEASARATAAAKAAKLAGLSQHEISHAIGEDWSKQNNPQYPPVQLNLEREVD